jgi:hypothetical protein
MGPRVCVLVDWWPLACRRCALVHRRVRFSIEGARLKGIVYAEVSSADRKCLLLLLLLLLLSLSCCSPWNLKSVSGTAVSSSPPPTSCRACLVCSCVGWVAEQVCDSWSFCAADFNYLMVMIVPSREVIVITDKRAPEVCLRSSLPCPCCAFWFVCDRLSPVSSTCLLGACRSPGAPGNGTPPLP